MQHAVNLAPTFEAARELMELDIDILLASPPSPRHQRVHSRSLSVSTLLNVRHSEGPLSGLYSPVSMEEPLASMVEVSEVLSTPPSIEPGGGGGTVPHHNVIEAVHHPQTTRLSHFDSLLAQMDQFDFGGVEHDQEDPHATLKGNAEASATFMDGKLQMDKSILRSKQSSFELRRAASKPCRRLSESEIDAWTRNSKLIPKISSLLQPRGSSASAKTDSKLDLMVVSPVSVEEEDVTEPEGRLEGGVEGSSSNPRLKGLKSVFQRSSWLRKH